MKVMFSEILRESKKAVRVRFDDHRVWIPHSQIIKEDLPWQILDIPAWLVRANGLEEWVVDKR